MTNDRSARFDAWQNRYRADAANNGWGLGRVSVVWFMWVYRVRIPARPHPSLHNNIHVHVEGLAREGDEAAVTALAMLKEIFPASHREHEKLFIKAIATDLNRTKAL